MMATGHEDSMAFVIKKNHTWSLMRTEHATFSTAFIITLRRVLRAKTPVITLGRDNAKFESTT